MRRSRPTAHTRWIALLLVPVFARIALTWGIGAAVVLTPAGAIIARSLAFVIAPQVARRTR